MKKMIMLTMCICWLMFLLSICCFASLPDYDYYKKDYDEYKGIIKSNPPPEDFVPYDRVAFLGKMENFSANKNYQNGYSYTVVGENNQRIYLYFDHAPMGGPLYIGTEYFRAQHIVDLKDHNSMLELDLEEFVGRTGYEIESGDKIHIDTGELRYWYDSRGALNAIVVYYNGSYCWIVSDFFEADANSWMGRLISREKSGKAATEIKARFAGYYSEPWEQPLTICLSAIGGAVVATVATWLVTYFVMRKKVKNTTRLGTNVGNLALAGGGTAPDGENATSESGASASPAPAEGIETDAAPPEDPPTPPDTTP